MAAKKGNVLSFPAAAEPKPPKKKGEYTGGLIRRTYWDPRLQKSIQKYGRTAEEAEAKIEAYKKQVALGTDAYSKTQSLTTWAAYWADTTHPKDKTTKSYLKKITGFPVRGRVLGAGPICDVKPMDIQLFANSLEHYSGSHVRKIKNTIHNMFESAIDNDVIDKNPCRRVIWRNAGDGTHRALEQWEIDLILKHHTEHRLGIMAVIMLLAGLRRGEALAVINHITYDLKKDIVNITEAIKYDGNTPVIGGPKSTAGERAIPIIPMLKNFLLANNGEHGKYLCAGANDDTSPMTETAFTSGWKSLVHCLENSANGEKAMRPGRRSDKDMQEGRISFFRESITKKGKVNRLPTIRTHDLRHTFCTLLYYAKVDIKRAQYLMGHADAKLTLETYTHLKDVRGCPYDKSLLREIRRMVD